MCSLRGLAVCKKRHLRDEKGLQELDDVLCAQVHSPPQMPFTSYRSPRRADLALSPHPLGSIALPKILVYCLFSQPSAPMSCITSLPPVCLLLDQDIRNIQMAEHMPLYCLDVLTSYIKSAHRAGKICDIELRLVFLGVRCTHQHGFLREEVAAAMVMGIRGKSKAR